jgi:hypothetical protein
MLYWPGYGQHGYTLIQVLARPDPSLFKSTGTVVFLVLVAGMNLDIYTDVKKHIKIL